MRIAIIGAGAAGLMSASLLCENNTANIIKEIIVYEKNNDLGKKLALTGGGRCNLTTGNFDIKEVLKNYPRGAKFLKYAMHEFSPAKVFNWFESHDVPLKIEKDLRVFPKSDNSKDIIDVFKKILLKSDIVKIKNQEVIKVAYIDNKFQIKTAENRESFDKIIITTGGKAYLSTGSQGDGYVFAKDLGHTINDLAESLNSFVTSDDDIKKLAGISLQNIKLSFKNKYKQQGSMVLTHHGISGPAVFALSSLMAYENFSTANPAEINIDFIPEKNPEIIKTELKNQRSLNPSKTIENIIALYIPKALTGLICSRTNLKNKKIAETGKKEINKLIENIKAFPIKITKRTPGCEMVTAGGVSLAEINPKTMESKLRKGLYFAGEILDIDGFTGGYNLQCAWSTAFVAAKHILNDN